MSVEQQELQVQQTAQPERKLTLFDIAGVINGLLGIMESAKSQEEFEEAKDLFGRFIETDLADKTDAIGHVDRQMDSKKAALKKDITLYQAEIDRIDKQQKRMHAMLRACLQVMNAKNIKGNVSTIRILEGKESLNVVDNNLVPARYFYPQTVTVRDNAAIKRDLKANLLVPGAELKPGDPTVSILPKWKDPAKRIVKQEQIEDSNEEESA